MTLHIEKSAMATDLSESQSQRAFRGRCEIIVTNSKHRSSTSEIDPDDATLSCANTEIYSQARSTDAVKRNLAVRIKRSKTGYPIKCC